MQALADAPKALTKLQTSTSERPCAGDSVCELRILIYKWSNMLHSTIQTQSVVHEAN
ncbi:hypothetical protein CY34DRAFT_811056 [Suillus luteus UH-Slu-Lm8-n1]|uniref:Uncharacterized protein n=1 Tax=Suillus luteus UH-Slu-Lm8-n1 TaxID=930992 RepID=A0A0D0AF38_9AGAM|nr:hypothetical protein CY34DRAFT_811056 [Suillus luteus UH-Slu-Lm8-n1]